jgi:hypothetical protein
VFSIERVWPLSKKRIHASDDLEDAFAVREVVEALGFDIYEPLARHPQAVYSRSELQAVLRHELVGRSYDPPIKTRAKLAKQAVAAALGYPVPSNLSKTKPRFPGQDLDVYVQQSDNLQIWNDEVSPTRRYAVLRVDEGNRVTAVRVVEGSQLAELDKTGTLTSKYQAKRIRGRSGSALVTGSDTAEFIRELAPVKALDEGKLRAMLPTAPPANGHVLAIATLHEKLLDLIGRELPYSPSERQRGELLHRAACEVLGLGSYADTGQFPDVVCQALEVKLQCEGTIDLGLVSPVSKKPALTLSPRLRHCDARYLVAYAVRDGEVLRIDHIVTSTGQRFFDEFKQFGGLTQNRKLQLRLPRGFFQSE